jgi:hypothetical protein
MGVRRVRYRRLITILVLGLWILAGPLVLMCGSRCASMSMACASLCALPPGMITALPTLTLLLHSTVPMSYLAHPLTPLVPVPTPPPKDVSFFA